MREVELQKKGWFSFNALDFWCVKNTCKKVRAKRFWKCVYKIILIKYKIYGIILTKRIT